MVNISNKILFVSLAVTLICGVFIYYSMRQRINQTEQNMDTMFNLVSSLNDEQKRLGNLVMYSINQQESSSKPPTAINATSSYDGNQDEEGEQPSIIMQEIEHSNIINLNDNMNDVEEDEDENDNSLNMINILLNGQEDLRVVVSDDEEEADKDDEDDEEDEEDEEEDVKLEDITLIDDDESSSSDDDDEQTVELSKMKVNELKQLLETLPISKGEIVKAKKLKKNELVAFIRQTTGQLEKTNDVDNLSEKPVNVADSLNDVHEDDDGHDDDNGNDENDDDGHDDNGHDDDDDEQLEDNTMLEDESDTDNNEPLHIHPNDDQVVELNDDDFNNDNFGK